jgi:UDP-glucuronate 4-epimerase
MSPRALVTGGAGFIGSHLVDSLLRDRFSVTVVDNFDDFYDPALKRRNVAPHLDHADYELVEADIRDIDSLRTRLDGGYDVIVHIAAKAGVRPSIDNPLAYQDVNVRGTQNLLELCRAWATPHFVFASSSSVYGVNPHVPWREDDAVLLPISPYASTKVSCELLGHAYSHLFGIRFLALRFFTVYGPRQRPDLAIHKFARLMLARRALPLFGDGSSRRDYTFVGDVIAGIRAAMRYGATPYEVINLGNNRTVSLLELVRALEQILGVRAALERLPEQPGDVPQTWADLEKARRLLGYSPATSLPAGLEKFAAWLLAQPEWSTRAYSSATAPSLPTAAPPAGGVA